MIEATQLCKVFIRDEEKTRRHQRTKTEFYAVDHLSLTVSPGEIVGILGPNGAGKTTLLRMLASLMEPTEGTVTITDAQGNRLTDPTDIKRHIGYLSGNTRLYHRLSTREMLRSFGEIYQIPRKETEERIRRIFALLDMESFGDNRIENLSTGQTQRAGIARCLIHQPDIYIFDEPTLGLDLISSEAIVNFMKAEKDHRKTIIYSTHYMEEAQYLCDRILMIYQGKIIASGTPQELMDQTGSLNLREVFFHIIRNGNTYDPTDLQKGVRHE